MSTLTYPFDVTGQLSSNKITNELHTLTQVNAAPYRIIVPKFAPFYLDNFELSYTDTLGNTRVMVEDVDYYICLPYLGATRSIGKLLYGGITISNDIINGSIKITYQTLGGEWLADSDYVLTRLAETVYNPRLTVWDVVTDKPNQFPPINHDHHMDFIYGHKDLIDAVNGIATNIMSGPSPTTPIIKHLVREDNPHTVTKTQVGLGLVANLAPASDKEVREYAEVDKYITLKQAIMLLEQGPKLPFSVIVPILEIDQDVGSTHTFKVTNTFGVISNDASDTSTFTLNKSVWTIYKEDGTLLERGEGIYDPDTKLSSYTNTNTLTVGKQYSIRVEYYSNGANRGTSDDYVFTTQLTPGDIYEGGYYVGTSTLNGKNYNLVISPKSMELQSKYQSVIADPYIDLYTVSGIQSLDDGLANTNTMLAENLSKNAIVFNVGDLARSARAANLSGHDDWYVPSKNELVLCYQKLGPAITTAAVFKTVGGQAFSASNYWTSTDDATANKPWYVNFDDGSSNNDADKGIGFKVRFMRRVEITT